MGYGRLFLILVASMVIFFLVDLCYAEKAPYSFAKEATSAPPEAYYDYIVVGGGTAGCALAATLATASAQVLLLERGGLPYDNPNVTNKTGFPLLLMDTSPNSPLQLFISTDGVFNHRPRILGGGSSVNGGFYSHASAKYVERMGWDPSLVKESYEWVEEKLVFQPRVHNWQAAVRDGLLEAGVLPDRGFTYEHLGGTKIGGTIFDQNGYRHTAADLLEYADPTRITTYLHSTVQKILINNINASFSGQKPKAYGVVFKDSIGSEHVAYLNNGQRSEIILSAGAIGSPQLLMLSGIGSAQHLRAHGIDVMLDQPMVGRGMSDSPNNGIFIPSRKPVDFSLIETVGISNVGSFIEAISGFLVSIPGMSKNYEELVNQAGLSFMTSNDQTILSYPYAQVGAVFEKVAEPFSTGYLELQSNDPNENPKVTFNYFKDSRDLKMCVKGMKIIKRVVESKSMSYFRYPSASFQSLMILTLGTPGNLRKKHAAAALSLKQFCIDTVRTIWHYHGGCQVDEVVDRDYKVIGVEALRVVDGSTFYASPGTNPQATVMMLGRYIGQKILQE